MRSSACLVLLTSLVVALAPEAAHAMCGCMLRPLPKQGETKGAKIVNKTSKVILARDADTTVLTMANDFEGAPAEFGMVIPVPSVINKSDVKIAPDKVFDALETATAPSVTEVFEPDNCNRPRPSAAGAPMAEKSVMSAAKKSDKASDYGVKVESHFFAGEYEIAVLSGKDAGGLVAWLQKFNYDVPDDAKEVLSSYIKQKMMFFLARVYVKEMGNERRHLRPIQVRYTTPKLMLPIRLGMVNADGPQELLVFTLTKSGRVESTNYRSVKMPTGAVLPAFVKNEWNDVYGAIFDEQEKREDMRVVLLESQKQIAADDDVKRAGAFWQSPQAFVTRMHFRYAASTFPEDLVLQQTSDQDFFQVNMTAMVPAANACDVQAAHERRQREQATLANLTGWPMEKVLDKVGGKSAPSDPKWYDKLWK